MCRKHKYCFIIQNPKNTVLTTPPCYTKIWTKTTISAARKHQKENHKVNLKVTWTFLFFAHTIGSTMLMVFSAIAAEKMQLKTNQFLDNAATNDETIISYQASYVILAIHSVVFFMSTDATFPPNIGTIHNTVQIIKQVMFTATKAKFGALYTNSELATQMRHTLAEMSHLQPQRQYKPIILLHMASSQIKSSPKPPK